MYAYDGAFSDAEIQEWLDRARYRLTQESATAIPLRMATLCEAVLVSRMIEQTSSACAVAVHAGIDQARAKAVAAAYAVDNVNQIILGEEGF